VIDDENVKRRIWREEKNYYTFPGTYNDLK